AVIIGAAFINTWVGVAVAVIAFVALTRWLVQEPVPGAADPPPVVASGTPPGTHRVLVVAPPGTDAVTVPDGAEVLVVVPALAAPRRRRPPRRSSHACPVRGSKSARTIRRSRSRTRCASSGRTRSSWWATTTWRRRSVRGSRFPSAAPSWLLLLAGRGRDVLRDGLDLGGAQLPLERRHHRAAVRHLVDDDGHRRLELVEVRADGPRRACRRKG